MTMIKCDCGSGQWRCAEFDGYGIFLCYVCEDCREQKMQRYVRNIKERYWADEPIEPDE